MYFASCFSNSVFLSIVFASLAQPRVSTKPLQFGSNRAKPIPDGIDPCGHNCQSPPANSLAKKLQNTHTHTDTHFPDHRQWRFYGSKCEHTFMLGTELIPLIRETTVRLSGANNSLHISHLGPCWLLHKQGGTKDKAEKNRELQKDEKHTAVTCWVQLKNSCVVLWQRNTSPCLSLCLPLAADKREGLHTCRNTMMHMELCRTTVGLQTPRWPQECECKHFVCTHTLTQTEADRFEGLWHVTAVHSDRRLQPLRGMKGKGSERATLRRNRNTVRRKTPAAILRPAESPHYWVLMIRF